MSVKMMMIGTGVMFAGIAGMAVNRLSDGALVNWLVQMRCERGDEAALSSGADMAVCAADTGLQWIYAIGGIFFIGVIINVYGRIKAAQARP